ncbi:DUF5677 domain-containing protein [Variovorax sp. GB1R11]|uniref:DUF5677 domain-containing protein n=1 Tax=Variovorax sp. GB1R11 TaxID=3443741 RepID=UPI003F480C39
MRSLFAEARALIEKELVSDVVLHESDHLGFMAMCFLYKQAAHARSIEMLLDAEQDVDAATISRTMLEGLILVAWAAVKPTERPLRWRAFSLVSDWKLLQRGVAPPFGTPEDKKVELKQRLEAHPEFLTSGARRAGAQALFDPYQNTWCVNGDGSRVELRTMAEEIGDPNMKQLYDELSQVGHWTPRGVAINIDHSTERSTLAFMDESLAAKACGTAFSSLVQTAALFFHHHRAEPHTRLQQIIDSYATALVKRD